MDTIFHEKQQGSLCAQHCLNALLQGPFFTAVDLAELAHQLDEAEQRHLLVQDGSHQSQNMDETGYFSIQVISKALSIWSLELVPLLQKSPEAEDARKNPENQRAFICNFKKHWFTIRRLGYQWFDLNSVQNKPRLISNTYLAIYLAQLQHEGHCIFFVTGLLPDCEADQLLSICPISEEDARLASKKPSSTTLEHEDDDEQVHLAMIASRAEADEEDISMQHVLEKTRQEEHDRELQYVLELSTREFHRLSSNSNP